MTYQFNNKKQQPSDKPPQILHRQVPLKPLVIHYFDKQIDETAKFCVMITNLGTLIKEQGFRPAEHNDNHTSAYDMVDSLETDVRTDFFVGQKLLWQVNLEQNGQMVSFTFKGLYEEAENHFVAYYEYKSDWGNSDKTFH